MGDIDDEIVWDTIVQELRGEIAEGLEQARQGALIPGDEVFASLRQKSGERGD